jgi:peptidoglycan/xylan/chitin deacetylase (PgdA/CDA1 family)
MFLFRVDIDSASGLLRGVPRILGILDRLELPGTFFSIMGWEGDLASTLRHRVMRSREGLPTGGGGGMGLGRLLEHSRCLVYPAKIPVLKPGLLREIEDGGHCLGVHGYVHVRWHSPTPGELEEEFELMISAYRDLMGKKPTSLATPLGHDGPQLRRLVTRHGFHTLAGLSGDPKIIPENNNEVNGGRGIHEIRMDDRDAYARCPSYTSSSTSPALVYIPVNIGSIELLRAAGASRSSTYQTITDQILEAEKRGGLASFYVHPRYEGSREIDLLEKILFNVKDSGIEAGTHPQFAEDFRKKELTDHNRG